MNTHLLLASALRTLIMGVTLFAALRLLRIHQVRAQRTAWLLALIAALVMPVLVGGGVGLRILPSFAHAPTPPAVRFTPRTATYLPKQALPTPPAHVHNLQALSVMPPAPVLSRQRRWPISYAATLYVVVAGFLLIRLFTGLTLALRLRSQAAPSDFPFDHATDIRISDRITTPVTIANSVLLPAASVHWSESKLRVVLSHERAHIRQHDFSIQLLAGLNCAIFWFNPFSWWLQKHLSALGEAMSDLAALEHAESRTSYAEVLLEFATSAQYPLAGVAMARTSGLRVRIERLLSERLFQQSYTGRRQLTILAAGIGVIAVSASTSLVRVHAAQTAVSANVVAPVHVKVNPVVTTTVTDNVVAPVSAMAHVTVSAADTVSAKQSAVVEVATNVAVDNAAQDTAPAPPAEPASPSPENRRHYNYSYNYNSNNNGDTYALVSGDGSVTFNGDYHSSNIDSLRSQIHGDFIFYRHDGKSYVIDDPTLVAHAKALYAPMEELGRQQEELGKQQEALGKQQEALGRQQEAVTINNPDLTEERAALAQIEEQMKTAEAAKQLDRESLGRLQEKLGQIQGKLGDLQGKAGEAQGKLGAEQGKLGEQQGKLGEQQGKLGEQQGKLSEEAQRQIVPMIQQAIQSGKARPVD